MADRSESVRLEPAPQAKFHIAGDRHTATVTTASASLKHACNVRLRAVSRRVPARMIWVDYVFIGIVLLSVLVGVFRGLVREALSLAVWVLAFALTLSYAPRLAEHLEASIKTPAVRTAAAYALVFFGVLIVGAVFTWAVSLLVKGIGLGGIDRMLGGGFGLLRGVFILVAVVMLAGASAATKDEPWWKQSILVPQLEPLSVSLQSLIPEQWLAYLRPRAVDATPPNSRPEH